MESIEAFHEAMWLRVTDTPSPVSTGKSVFRVLRESPTVSGLPRTECPFKFPCIFVSISPQSTLYSIIRLQASQR